MKNLHKVAAIVSNQDGLPAGSEITVKTAAQCLGTLFFRNYLEKKAMLDGIVNAMYLLR